jgi:nicotinamide-nucleotide adenylyltransferase
MERVGTKIVKIWRISAKDNHAVDGQREPWWNLDLLLRFRAAIELLDSAPSSTLTIIRRARHGTPKRLILFPGSFNPPTIAHVGLAEALMNHDLGDEVWFTVSARTIDKEQVTGAMLEDRLAMLLCLVRDSPDFGIALSNRGLFVDIAEAAHQLFRDLDGVSFLVGYDKIVQILNPRYYEDRDAALERLFHFASFRVARRAGSTDNDVHELLGRPENRRFAQRIDPLPKGAGDAVSAMSSSLVRRQIEDGLRDRADVAPCVARFIGETGAYQRSGRDSLESDLYAARRRVFARFGTHDRALPGGEFRRLIEDAAGNGVPPSS